MGEGSEIGKIKVLENSLKRSFANVRLDILNIKDYLEKQHDIINSELADLQSQLFSVKRDLVDNKRVLGESYVKKDALEKRLKNQIKSLKELREELDGFDSRIDKTSKKISIVERESLSSEEFKKKSRATSKEIEDMRNELDQEVGLIGEELSDIRKELKNELIREQAKVFGEKVRRLDKSLEEVDGLKEDLRKILESSKKREKVKREVIKFEEKISKKPFYKRVWAGVLDFFEEEPEEEVVVKKVEKKVEKRVALKREPGFLERAKQSIVNFFTEEVEEKPIEVKEKPKRRAKKRERDYRPLVFGVFIALILFGLAYYYFSDEIFSAFSGMLGMKNVSTVEIPESEAIVSSGVVITVNETDFVDIIPDASDPDKDKLTYTFSYPLNKSGQWQTQIGDAGTYPITVTVSDGNIETKMDFILIVEPIKS